jgi:hypothetical protein
MILNCWIIVSFSVASKAPGSAVYSDPSKRKLKHYVYVMLDKNCGQNMCPKCYVGCWNHTANTQASAAMAKLNGGRVAVGRCSNMAQRKPNRPDLGG